MSILANIYNMQKLFYVSPFRHKFKVLETCGFVEM
jgi:hypothetical protein